VVFRHIRPGLSPTSGAGARSLGGRWNPPASFPALYTGLAVETVEAELARLALRNNLRLADLLPRVVHTLEVRLSAVVDLRGEASLLAVGLTMDAVLSDDLRACQEVGEAAHKLGREGILAPSATGVGDVLAIFELNLEVLSVVRSVSHVEWRPPV
jgi:RES domain-containing protein